MNFMKKITLVVVGVLLSFAASDAGERVQFSVKNQTLDNGVYSADVWAKMPTSGTNWAVGSCNILFNYNSSALNPSAFNNDTVINKDSELGAYSITQTQAGSGRIALNILDPGQSNIVTKIALDSFRIATVRWTVTNNSANDGLSFFTNGTEVYEGTSTALSYNCSTPSCFTVVEPGSQPILSGDPVVVTQPEDQDGCAGGSVSFVAEATGIPAPTVQWQLNTGGGWNNMQGAVSTTLTMSNLNDGFDGWMLRACFNNGGDNVYSQSAELSILSTTLTVTAPSDGQLLTAGSEFNITWGHTFCTDSITEVALKYSTNAGVNYSLIAITDNDGSFAWTVPAVATEQAMIKVISTQWQSIEAESSEFSIQVSSNTVPVPWSFTGQTGNNSTIIVPASASMTIGNRDIQVGDAIGAFYSSNGEEFCAGYVVWPDSSTALTVWGDNDQTPGKDGYAVNEDYYLKLWDGEEGTEYPAQSTFAFGNDYYTVDGYSILGSLLAVTADTLNIALDEGWNMISSNVEPDALSLPTVMSDISSNVTIVKNGAGQVYVPLYGINNIGDWNMLHGYQVYMADSDTLSIVGDPDPTTTPLAVSSGWNLVSYLRNSPQNAATALASINSNLTIAKNGAGQVYVPLYGINNIGNMNPGEGYQLYLASSDIITYPANGSSKRSDDSPDIARAIYVVPEHIKTGANATILVEAPHCEDGIEFGVFATDGVLVGSGVVSQGVAALTVWGDNEHTQNVDGAAPGEVLALRAWNPQLEREIGVSEFVAHNMLTGSQVSNLLYLNDAVFIAKTSVQIHTDAAQLQVTPNPASDIVTLSTGIEFEGVVIVSVFDNAGQMVLEMQLDGSNFVETAAELDVSRLASGVYTISVRDSISMLNSTLTIVR